MKTFSFHSGPGPNPTRYLFNDPKHLALQSHEVWIRYYALNEKQQVIAFVWVHVVGALAASPLRAPFGSFEFDQRCEPIVLFNFISYVQEELIRIGVKKILLKNPPDTYHPSQQALLTTFLLNQGFTVKQAELSSIIPVTATVYETHLSDWENRKLKQAKTAKLRFQQHPITDLPILYSFIETCRKEKNYLLSMSLDAVQQVANNFPKKVLLFSVSQQTERAAACIALQVSDDIVYTFYYDHAAAFQVFSPVVLLMEGIYEYCQGSNIRVLDLGTASINGEPNFPLLTFKNHLGGLPSTKLTFEKEC